MVKIPLRKKYNCENSSLATAVNGEYKVKTQMDKKYQPLRIFWLT